MRLGDFSCLSVRASLFARCTVLRYVSELSGENNGLGALFADGYCVLDLSLVAGVL